MKPTHVMIGLPTMGSIHATLAVAIAYWVAQAHKSNKYNISIYYTIGVQPVDNARNEIVEEFLNREDTTHLFFVDADTLPPLDAIDRLLEHDLAIVSGLTPIIDQNPVTNKPYARMNCADMNEDIVQPDTGLVKIKGAGGSCIMIKKAVFERLEKPYYRFLYKDDNGKPTIVSEDIYFIAKCVGAGIQPYCDSSVVCKHYKTTEW